MLTAVFAATAKATGRASIASIAICALWPIGVGLSGRPAAEVALTACIGALVIVRHQSNIRRLLGRTEPRLEA
jgi:glycerol-3-phosphate acyltransferase PlsY